MIDPERTIPRTDLQADEASIRRHLWTRGRPVQLADGGSWWLPRIDWSLVLFRPDVLAKISRTFDLADQVWQAEPDAKRHLMATAIYHTQLAQLAVDLLQVNYDLPDEHWRRLVSFEQLNAMLRLTLAVSQEVADSIPAWMPFYLASGGEGSGSLLLN